MILVDSSVWIDYFRGTVSAEADRLDAALDNERIVVGDIILAEVLRGFAVDKHFNEARRMMLRCEQVSLAGSELAIDAAMKCRFLRVHGITVRGTLDAIIATAEQAVRSSTDGFREDLRRAEGAVGLPIEAVDSLRLLATSRYTYLDAIIDYNRAQFELYVALGQPPADTLAHPVPSMLLQPIVENSIKHGLLHQQGVKTVRVHFDYDQTDNSIVCTVEDNGIGREKAAAIQQKNAQTHQSFATQATEQRLGLLEGQKSSMLYEDLLDTDQKVCGTKVTLRIALG